MKRNYEVRKAHKADIPGIMKLLYQVHAVHAAGRPDIFIPGRVKYNEEELELIISDHDHKPVYVAVDENGKVLGHCFSIIEDHRNSTSLVPGVSLYIDDICVDEAARGSGVGRAIYEYVRNQAVQAGYDRITLNVWECNPGAAEFYRALGFKPLKVTMEAKL